MDTITQTKSESEKTVNNNNKTYFVFNEKDLSQKALNVHRKNVNKYHIALTNADGDQNNKKVLKAEKWLKNWMMETSDILPLSKVDKTNGDIVLEQNAEAGNIKTVNGNIYIEENVKINGNIDTVNGTVTIEKGSIIFGDVITINGNVDVHESNIDGSVDTHNGNINVSSSTVKSLITISGNIIIEESVITEDINVNKSSLWVLSDLFPVRWFKKDEVIIGRNSVVMGSINIDSQDLDLYVHNSASISNVTGTDVIPFFD